jgi:acyl-coenzyme A thioesterase PaaI-like protein
MRQWPRISLKRDPDYNDCFGCGKDNPIGLKLSFKWDGKIARAEFTPESQYQGWPGILHGGIVACLLDEGMGYAAIFDTGYCLTARMEIKLKKVALVNEPLVIEASVVRKTRKIVHTMGRIKLRDGTTVAEGAGTHFVVNTEQIEEFGTRFASGAA